MDPGPLGPDSRGNRVPVRRRGTVTSTWDVGLYSPVPISRVRPRWTRGRGGGRNQVPTTRLPSWAEGIIHPAEVYTSMAGKDRR